MRELKNLPVVIARAYEWQLDAEELTELVSKVRVSWAWGRNEFELAEKTSAGKSWLN